MATERVPRPERWNERLDPGMTESDVDRLLELEPFRSIDASKFPASLPLRGILKNDCRLRRFQEGDIVVRQGDYGNTAFYVVRGTLRVVLGGDDNELPAEVLGRLVSNKKRFFDALGQLFRRSKYPEVRHKAARSGNVVGHRGATGDEDVRIFLQDVPGVLDEHRTATLDAGEFFGEIAALGRTPRTTTVFSHEGAEVLEIRWQGLRDIRRRSEKIREHIDTLYRENSLRSQLRATPLFRHLSHEDLVKLAEATVFETYGTFDWFHGYKKLSNESYAERLAKEPLIAEEGSTANGVILIRAGFARMSRKYNHGHRTLSYLSKGQVFGLEEVAHAFEHGVASPYQSSLRAIGYVDTLLVPADVMKTLVLPSMPAELLPSPPEEPAAGGPSSDSAPQPLMEFIGDKRLVNGTAAMVINLDRCVRCDDCVRGCAAAHDGNPRFVRHGPQHGALQVANACMHCVDPVCMIGCPTGAIHRDESHGEILINDATCIGCSVCANSCPYDNIRMVAIRDPEGRQLLSEASGQPLLEATKCDLCAEQPSGPACVSACAHDALRRVDLNDWSQLASWLPKVRALSAMRMTRAPGLTLGGAILVVLAVRALEARLWRTEHATGWLLLVALVALAAFGLRKKVPYLPLGSAATWLRVHLYLGFFAIVLLGAHVGVKVPNGVLEVSLAAVFGVVTLSGIAGIALSRSFARRLTTRGQEVIWERIPELRKRIRDEAEAIVQRSVGHVPVDRYRRPVRRPHRVVSRRPRTFPRSRAGLPSPAEDTHDCARVSRPLRERRRARALTGAETARRHEGRPRFSLGASKCSQRLAFRTRSRHGLAAIARRRARRGGRSFRSGFRVSFKLQGFGNRESHYERPSDDWVCGRAAAGTPCELGVSPGGRCSLTGETGCRPVRSVRARRAWLTRWTLITTVAALALLLTGPRASWFASPGELSFHHADGARREARGGAQCGDCHTATAVGLASFTAAIFRHQEGATESRLCLQCHALGEFAMESHSRDPESLGAAPSQRSGVACATCHSEHRGRSHDLTELDDVRCQACHTERFESFEADHPELVDYPNGNLNLNLRFDHRSHAFQNFRKERNGTEDREFRCLGCHVPDGSRRHMLLHGYDESCASCHDQQIADGGDVAFVTLLGLDTMSLEDMKVAIGQWPSEEEPEPSVITELLLRGEEGAGEYLDVLATIDPLDLAAVQNEELAAVRAYAWSGKKLMVDLRERGHEAIADRLAATLGARLPAHKLIRLVGGLPHETVVAATSAWFPAVENELSLEASGTPPATELVYPEPEADAPKPPGGGWHRDDYEMRLLYRPTGHADALIRAWIELGATRDVRPLFDSLTSDFAPGRCAKCHVLEPGSVI